MPIGLISAGITFVHLPVWLFATDLSLLFDSDKYERVVMRKGELTRQHFIERSSPLFNEHGYGVISQPIHESDGP